jgi:hypothetical protein
LFVQPPNCAEHSRTTIRTPRAAPLLQHHPKQQAQDNINHVPTILGFNEIKVKTRQFITPPRVIEQNPNLILMSCKMRRLVREDTVQRDLL